MVFASPLLAFLLSLLVGKSEVRQRAAFFVSYVGLPLLYAAYNTFDPVYHWIIRGLSFASGGTAGSPQDVTDSLVIPFGLAIAVLVWRRVAARAERPRLRWAPLMAGIAALASVATSYPEPDVGITAVGIGADGTACAGAAGPTEARGYYLSLDGGMSWERESAECALWSGPTAETPMGTYAIRGADIVLVGPDGESRTAYTSHLGEDANLWVQERSTTQLGLREIATMPLGVVYDDRTGNIIAAMGIQGVVVGTPDGAWARYSVGRYRPTDFSFTAKARLLLSSVGFWLASLALSLSMTGSALVLSRYQRTDLTLLAIVVGGFLAVIALPFALLTTGRDMLVVAAFALSLVVILALALVSIVLGIVSNNVKVQKGAGLVVGVSSVLAACLMVILFGVSDVDGSSGFELADLLLWLLAMLPIVGGLSTVAIARPGLRQWPAMLVAMLVVNAASVLAFLLWLRVDVALARAQVSSIVLAFLAGLVLFGYLKWQRQPASEAMY